MTWTKRIHCDPRNLCGKPVIKGTRLAVEFLFKMMSQGVPDEEILRNYRD